MNCQTCHGTRIDPSIKSSDCYPCKDCNGTGQADCCSGEQCEPTNMQLNMEEVVEGMDK